MASINFLVKQGEKLVESSLLKKSTTLSTKGLRYAPKQLSTDIVELTQKTKLDPKILQELVNKGLSLHQMASELGVKVGKVRIHLNKNNIISDAQSEFRMLKRYFTATTQQEKAKAFREIDKHLEQIAKEEFKLKKGISYEDCLQDVRLRFFELVDKNQKKGISFPKGILKIMRTSQPEVNQQLKTVELKHCNFGAVDNEIVSFESNNYDNFLWDFFYKKLRYRDTIALEKYIREGEQIGEIAKSFGLTESRTRSIIREALPKLREQFEKLTAREFRVSYNF